MGQVKMLGALVGDIIGSTYEFYNTKRMDFDLFEKGSCFTDDSVMTLAVAKWLVEDEAHTIHYLIYCMQELGDHHPHAGYGGRFAGWLCEDDPQPYNSWGNGAGMRVSPVGLYAKTLDEALALAALTASVSHNHPEGVKGAQALLLVYSFVDKASQSRRLRIMWRILLVTTCIERFQRFVRDMVLMSLVRVVCLRLSLLFLRVIRSKKSFVLPFLLVAILIL